MNITTIYRPLLANKTKYEGIYLPKFSFLLSCANGYLVHDHPEIKVIQQRDITLEAYNAFLLFGALKEAVFPTVPLLFLPDSHFSKMCPMVRELRKFRNMCIDLNDLKKSVMAYAAMPVDPTRPKQLWTRSVNIRFTCVAIQNPTTMGTFSNVESLFSHDELKLFLNPTSLPTAIDTIVARNQQLANEVTPYTDTKFSFQEDRVSQIIRTSICRP